MIVRKIKAVLFLLCLLPILGCSIDFKDPEKVISSYYQAAFSDKDFKRSYKYLSLESKKHTSFDEYQKGLNDKFKPRKIVSINTLQEDKKKPTYRRIKVIFEITDKEKTFKDIAYYTLINEAGKWKILWLWTHPVLKSADDQSNKGFYREAIKQYEEILSIDPYFGLVYNGIAWCYKKLGEREKFLENIKTAIALEPDRRKYYFTMAEYYYEVEQLTDLAIENIKKVISSEYGSDSDKSNAFRELSKYYQKQKDYENAVNAVDKAIELNPDNASAYWRKSEILLSSSGQTIINFNFRDNSSKTISNLNLMEKTSKLLLKAVEVNEKNEKKLAPNILPDLYYQLAVVEAYLEDYINAKKHVLKALELRPDDNQAKSFYQAIEIAKLDWFLTPEGAIKEFELRLPASGNRVVGKEIEPVPKVEFDESGNIFVIVNFISQLGGLNTKGFRIYKLDTKTERVLLMATKNETTDIENTYVDNDYIIMYLPLTVGKEWEYKFERPKIPLETDETNGKWRYKHEVVTHIRKVIGKEKIKLPAGEFETIVILDEGMGDMEYYAKNVGLVAIKSRNAISKEWWMIKRLTKLSKRK